MRTASRSAGSRRIPEVAHALDLAHEHPRARPRIGRHRANRAIGFIRRLWNLVLEDVPGPWRFHFDFRIPDGTLVMSSDRRKAMRDVYDARIAPSTGAARW